MSSDTFQRCRAPARQSACWRADVPPNAATGWSRWRCAASRCRGRCRAEPAGSGSSSRVGWGGWCPRCSPGACGTWVGEEPPAIRRMCDCVCVFVCVFVCVCVCANTQRVCSVFVQCVLVCVFSVCSARVYIQCVCVQCVCVYSVCVFSVCLFNVCVQCVCEYIQCVCLCACGVCRRCRSSGCVRCVCAPVEGVGVQLNDLQ